MEKTMILDELKKNGKRITQQRKILVDVIVDRKYSNCKEVYNEAVKIDPTIGLSTVYRMFNNLENIGLIKKDFKCSLNHNQSDNFNIVSIYHDLLIGIVAAMEARDQYTSKHSMRVSDMTEMICKYMNLKLYDEGEIHIAAHLHDIGKIGIPDEILMKPDKLSNSDWLIMRKHPVMGYEILSPVHGFQGISKIVRHHHERYDGNGYPDGLAGDNIPLGSRIIAIADSIDAMLSNRQYRKGLTEADCLREIKLNSGKMYDPTIVEIVVENWREILDIRVKNSRLLQN